MIRAITFDFWRTLFRDANSAKRQHLRVSAFAQATGVRESDVAAAMQQVWKEFARCHREEQRTLYPEDAVRLTAEALGVSLSPEQACHMAEVFATAILVHPPEPIDQALDAVRAAAELRPVGLICDSGVSPGRSLRHLLERHGFLEYMKVLVFSDVVSVSKPQRPMFEAAARGLNVGLNQLLHIGDLEHTDIVGAKAVGAQAALFVGDNDTYLGQTTADHTFETWRQFIQCLPRLCPQSAP